MLDVAIKKKLGNFNLDISFNIEEKTTVGILGASGGGKSVLLKCISGLYTPDSGKIVLNDKELYNNEKKIDIPSRKRNIGYVFQNYALFPHLTVFENIEYGIKSMEKNKRREKIKTMIEKTCMTGLESRYPKQLSGGQQQRVALARTLITEPELLLLDEPFSALDSHVKILLEKELIGIIEENFNGLVLMVTHNLKEAYRICDNIMVIDSGKKAQIGDKDDVVNNPKHVSVAKITGCKNIIPAKIIDENTSNYFVKFGKNTIRVEKNGEKLKGNIFLGVRSHNIEIVEDETITDTENMIEIRDYTVIEEVFRRRIVVTTDGLELDLEVDKDSNYEMKSSIKIKLPPEKIFIMKREH